MALITIYSLVGDDVRILTVDMNNDYIFFIMTSVAFIMFSVEIVLSCFILDGYWLGFYFWLDIISTASLIADIGWIMNLILGVGNGNQGGSNA